MMQSAGAGESPLDWVQQQIAKWQVLVRDGVMDQAQYENKVRHLQNQQRVGEAGVGMTITECAPYKVLELTPRGPAYKSGKVMVGDTLIRIGLSDPDRNVNVRSLSGGEVRAAIVGQVGTPVTLYFEENPRRSETGKYGVRLTRAPPDSGGDTHLREAGAPAAQRSPPDPPARPQQRPPSEFEGAERAIKSLYDPVKKKWEKTLINVIVNKEPFASGAMRHAYHMQDLSMLGADRAYVIKISKNKNEETQTYYDDVQMQMEAKMYADMYNATGPPKTVDFLAAYVLELMDRPGKPVCGVEKYIEGEYVKYNNNWDWNDEKRNTPQAFSHFTWHASKGTLLICDIQGVGDLYTDPQIHSSDGRGYGLGNLGQKGIDRFLAVHECNGICQWLSLPNNGRFKRSSGQAQATLPLAPRDPGTVAAAPHGAARASPPTVS